MEKNHPNSTLNLNLADGYIYYLSGNGMSSLCIYFLLNVSGKFVNNLHPISLTLSYGAIGQDQKSAMVCPEPSPLYSHIPVSRNISNFELRDLLHEGQSYSTVSALLINQYTSDPFYNFSACVQMKVNMLWLPDTNHLFNLSAQVNGLSKPVNSTLSLNIFEKG